MATAALHPWLDDVRFWLAGRPEVTMDEIVTGMMVRNDGARMMPSDADPIFKREVGKVLKLAGYYSQVKWRKGRTVRVYIKAS